MDNTLAYIDQASFQNFRALGHGPVIQFTWIYDQPINQSALQKFHRNLSHGLLGRLIERSPLPFGRHRWVSSSGPPSIDDYTIPIAQSQLHEWLDSLVNLVIDPELGPGWRLATIPLLEGGSAICLQVSHSIADGLGAVQAISNAIENRECSLNYPRARSRRLWDALKQDTGSALDTLPDQIHAIRLAAKLIFRASQSYSSRKPQKVLNRTQKDHGLDSVPCISVYVNELDWVHCAKRLGGTSNSLHAGLAVILGSRLGRADRNGNVKLNIPVSLRQKVDTRANALSMVSITVDPSHATHDLNQLNIAIKNALSRFRNEGDLLHQLLALIPFVPESLTRILNAILLESGMPVGCSILGKIDSHVNHPCETEAKLLDVRLAEETTLNELERSSGKLFLGSHHMKNQISISIAAWQPGTANSREALKEKIEQALKDFGLSATLI